MQLLVEWDGSKVRTFSMQNSLLLSRKRNSVKWLFWSRFSRSGRCRSTSVTFALNHTDTLSVSSRHLKWLRKRFAPLPWWKKVFHVTKNDNTAKQPAIEGAWRNMGKCGGNGHSLPDRLSWEILLSLFTWKRKGVVVSWKMKKELISRWPKRSRFHSDPKIAAIRKDWDK